MRQGVELWDLTVADPARARMDFDRNTIERAFGQASHLPYSPSPRGLASARQTLVESYASRGYRLTSERFLLTASTSESYSYLVKLLANPGDRLLTSCPGYPLIDLIAASEGVGVDHYPLVYDGRWNLDLAAIESFVQRPKAQRPKALLLVHPNNPTGCYVSQNEAKAIRSMCAKWDVPLVVDEVFLLFDHQKDGAAASFVDADRGLVFVVDGISKQLGLPGLKLGWIYGCGDDDVANAALNRLEWLADLFLSVTTPVQHALPALLAGGGQWRLQVLERVSTNLAMLEHHLKAVAPVDVQCPEGGWYVMLRLPKIRSSEAWARSLLSEANVITHPGSLFGLPEAYLVLSLLTPPRELENGARAMRRFFSLHTGPLD